ncbi:hypothetical protein KBB08_03125 [Candidatus Gracilibacteria bacterium]|nr:hypothetical protein [Candidatus Gracilibacteria bacterium]
MKLPTNTLDRLIDNTTTDSITRVTQMIAEVATSETFAREISLLVPGIREKIRDSDLRIILKDALIQIAPALSSQILGELVDSGALSRHLSTVLEHRSLEEASMEECSDGKLLRTHVRKIVATYFREVLFATQYQAAQAQPETQQNLHTKLDQVQNELQGALLPAIRQALAKSFYRNGHVRDAHTTGVRVLDQEQYAFDTRAERVAFATRTVDLPLAYINTLLSQIDLVALTNCKADSGKERQRVTAQTKRNLRHFITQVAKGLKSTKLQSPSGEPVSEQQALAALTKLTTIWTALFQEQRYQLHFHTTDQQLGLCQALFDGLLVSNFDLSIVTCPDYSGTFVSPGVWKFDFQDVGTTVGIVGQKAFDFVEGVAKVLHPYGNVKITHFLPTFECPEDGAYGISKADFSARLAQSLTAIAAEYQRRQLPAQTQLTTALLDDQQFWKQKQLVASTIRAAMAVDTQLAHNLRHQVRAAYRFRSQLYQEWNPPEATETVDAYQARVQETVIQGQMAEYLVIAERLTAKPGSIYLDCSSPHIATVAALYGYPILMGQSTSAANYLGA